MERKIMMVTAAYGHDQVRAAGEQTAMLPIIAEAGADGVEIRRELLADVELKTLSTMASAIEIFGLLVCYSAPEPLFLEDGNLNPCFPELLEEARALQTLWLKVSLGRFSHTEQFDALRQWLDNSGMELVIENDQTDCGRLQPMQRFNEVCQTQNLPISLTFDMSDWLWVGDSPEQATQNLASTAGYIHVKAVVTHRDSYRAVPPDEADPRWLALLKTLPNNVPRGIEFPLEGQDLAAVTRRCVELLREE